MIQNKKIIIISAVISILLLVIALLIVFMVLRKPDATGDLLGMADNNGDNFDVKNNINDKGYIDEYNDENSSITNNSQDNINDESLENDNQNIRAMVSIYDAKLEDLRETEIVTPSTYSDTTKYPLVASIPDKDIYLYGADDGVILRQVDILKPLEWVYLTPRFILPRIVAEDIDNDGVEEILCILYVGSGTGISIEELHILEPDDTEIYRDLMFLPDDYINQLHDLISFQYDKENNKLYYIVDEEDIEFDAPIEFTDFNFQSIYYGFIIYFYYENEIIMEIAPEYYLKGRTAPFYFNRITAKVIYEDENFTITDLVIHPPKE